MQTDLFGAPEAAHHIAVPGRTDDKYSRGVLGVLTGSDEYPGAAILGVEAALRTGVGMVRYVGSERAENLILQRRPEAVMAFGRVQAWLIGSGMDFANRGADAEQHIGEALAHAVPLVLDGGAIDVATRVTAPAVITPHYRELARLMNEPVERIAAEPERWAGMAAQRFAVTVLLKGHTSYVTDGERMIAMATAPAWLATAGSGDALGGILGALVATHSESVRATPATLVGLAATACYLHSVAALRASAGGPLTVLDLCGHVSAVVAELVAEHSPDSARE
ncbi:MAG: ADP-dependent NAD(P)H-hydrate dehydratase [Rhodoglobus sp.]